MTVIAADIGGTKVLIGAYAPSSPNLCGHQASYSSIEFASFADLFARYLDEHKLTPTELKIGIAGPVIDNSCTATNLPWSVSADELSKKFALKKVILANDLVASAYGIVKINHDKLFHINHGVQKPGNQALIAAGTGLGEAILFWDGTSYIASSSEGGHCNFGPSTDEQIALLSYLQRKHQHVSWERVVSGSMGFANIYKFLLSQKSTQASFIIDPNTPDANYGPAITKAAQKNCPLAIATIRLFLSLYGAEASNLALKSMSVNGLYIAGGVIQHLMPWLKKTDWFWQGFTNKGRFSELMQKIPVIVITDPQLPLEGAAALPN